MKYLVSTPGKEVYLMDTSFCRAERQESRGDDSASISSSSHGLVTFFRGACPSRVSESVSQSVSQSVTKKFETAP